MEADSNLQKWPQDCLEGFSDAGWTQQQRFQRLVGLAKKLAHPVLWADLKMNQMVRHLRFPESVDQWPDLEGFVALRVRHHVDSRLEWAVNLALLDVSGSSPTGVEL